MVYEKLRSDSQLFLYVLFSVSMKYIVMTMLAATAFSCTLPRQPMRIDVSNPVKPVVSVAIDGKENKYVRNATEDVAKTLQVFMVIDGKVSSVPLAGKYYVESDALRFIPGFDLEHGLEFEAQYYSLNDTLRRRFTIEASPLPETPPAEVIRVYPLTDTLPANILLFYVEFSLTMEENMMAFHHVAILDENGVEKPMVWLQRSNWIHENHVLVLMIHPGRVKRGINYASELGEIFTPGKTFELVVTTDLNDQRHRKLSHEYRKKFFISGNDREIPKIEFSNFTIPKKNSSEPLRLVFSEGMDYGSMSHGIKVLSLRDSSVIEGELKPVSDRQWDFFPSLKWQKEEYEVQFDKTVADVASNYLHRPFEITDLRDRNEEGMPQRWKFVPW